MNKGKQPWNREWKEPRQRIFYLHEMAKLCPYTRATYVASWSKYTTTEGEKKWLHDQLKAYWKKNITRARKKVWKKVKVQWTLQKVLLHQMCLNIVYYYKVPFLVIHISRGNSTEITRVRKKGITDVYFGWCMMLVQVLFLCRYRVRNTFGGFCLRT